MAVLRTHQFFNGQVTASGVTTVYTVPAGKTIIVKEVELYNAGAVTITARLATNGRVLRVWSLTASGTAGASAQWTGWLVLVAGDTLQISLAAAGTVNVVAGGSLLFV